MCFLIRGALILGAGLFVAVISMDATAQQRARLEARMTASSGPASGKAKYDERGFRRRVSVEVENANPGVQLKICLQRGKSIQIMGVVKTNDAGAADLNLDTGNGQGVLAMRFGDVIIVKQGDIDLMSGVFRSKKN